MEDSERKAKAREVSRIYYEVNKEEVKKKRLAHYHNKRQKLRENGENLRPVGRPRITDPEPVERPAEA